MLSTGRVIAFGENRGEACSGPGHRYANKFREKTGGLLHILVGVYKKYTLRQGQFLVESRNIETIVDFCCCEEPASTELSLKYKNYRSTTPGYSSVAVWQALTRRCFS